MRYAPQSFKGWAILAGVLFLAAQAPGATSTVASTGASVGSTIITAVFSALPAIAIALGNAVGTVVTELFDAVQAALAG